jgi:hypothetical protein
MVAPGDLLSLRAAANFCWHQFAELKGVDGKKGEEFKQAYPLEKPFVDGDFENDATKPGRHDLIGQILVNPDASSQRTLRIFADVLRGSGDWSFTESGAMVDLVNSSDMPALRSLVFSTTQL